MDRFVNVTPHPVTFVCLETGDVYTILPSGVVLSATPVEEPAGSRLGTALVRTRFEASQDALDALSRIEREHPDALVVGSLIAAQAFAGRVVAMIAAPGFERAPAAEKRMRDDKFTVF